MGSIDSVAFSWQLCWTVQEGLLHGSAPLPASLLPLGLLLSLPLPLLSRSWASSQHGGFLHGCWLPRVSTSGNVHAQASNRQSYTASPQLHAAFHSQAWGQPRFKGWGNQNHHLGLERRMTESPATLNPPSVRERGVHICGQDGGMVIVPKDLPSP